MFQSPSFPVPTTAPLYHQHTHHFTSPTPSGDDGAIKTLHNNHQTGNANAKTPASRNFCVCESLMVHSFDGSFRARYSNGAVKSCFYFSWKMTVTVTQQWFLLLNIRFGWICSPILYGYWIQVWVKFHKSDVCPKNSFLYEKIWICRYLSLLKIRLFFLSTN